MKKKVKSGLKFRIDELIKERNIQHPAKTFKPHGISSDVLQAYRHNKRYSMPVHHAEGFAKEFNCEINDLYVWEPLEKRDDTPDNPMQRYRKRSTFNLDDEIRKRTPEELRKMFEKDNDARKDEK